MLYLAAGVVGLLGVVWCATRTPATRLVVASFLALPQFYIPSLPISVSDVWLTVLAALAVIDLRVRLVKPWVVLPVFGLVGVYLLAQFWSTARFHDANMLVIFRFALFGFILCYALSVIRENRGVILRAVRWATPAVLVQSGLTILFILSPDAESAFLQSSVGSLFVGPQAEALWNGAYNNVLDPAKAGGFFVNGNVASMFGGVAFFLFILCRRLGGSRWYMVWALAALAGTVATGSKTGITLAVSMPVLYLLASRLLRGKGRIWILPASLTGVPALMVLPHVIDTIFPQFAENSVRAYGQRDALWAGAVELFHYSPFLGLGFGGWDTRIGAVTGVYRLPPHNLVIASWANGGAGAALCVVAFMLVVVISLAVAIWRSTSATEAKLRAAALCAALWVFIHGMGDNTNIYGHQTTMLFAALLVGVLAMESKGDTEPYPLSAGGGRFRNPVAPELLRSR